MHDIARQAGEKLAQQIDTILSDAVKRRWRTDWFLPDELQGRMTRTCHSFAPNAPVTYCLDHIPLVTFLPPSITHVCDKGSYSIVVKQAYQLHP